MTGRPAPITWQTAICEATRTGWHFQLPVTVSTNRLWRHGKNRTYKSAEARDDAQDFVDLRAAAQTGNGGGE